MTTDLKKSFTWKAILSPDDIGYIIIKKIRDPY